MAKILDKMYNRIIDGKILEISDAEIQELGLAKKSEVYTRPSADEIFIITKSETEAFNVIQLSEEQVSILDKYSVYNVNYYDNENDYHYNIMLYKDNASTITIMDDTGAPDYAVRVMFDFTSKILYVGVTSTDVRVKITPLF